MLFNKTLHSLGASICFILLCCSLSAQQAEASSSKEIRANITNDLDLEGQNYGALISSQYIQRFGKLSVNLEQREKDLAVYFGKREKLELDYQQASSTKAKKNIKQQIEDCYRTESNLHEEIKLIKRGLRLLQMNKSKSDAEKLQALKKVDEIDTEILLLNQKSANQMSDNFLSSVTIDDRNTYLDPAQPACKIAYIERDKKGKIKRIETEREPLFGYTHPKLKSYFKEKDFLTCEAQVIMLNNKSYLWLHFTLASKDAIKNYGFIEKNSPIKIQLLDSDIIYVGNTQTANGRLEPYTGYTKYELTIPLDKTNLKHLEKAEIDKIGIMWSSGFEQYEIYNVDLVMNQINCVKNN